MPYGSGYGGAYRGQAGQFEDPLATAIDRGVQMFMTVRQLREQSAEAKRRAQEQDEEQAFRREQFEYGKQQDELSRQERGETRREAFLERTGDRGLAYTGNPKMPFLKTGPTKVERDADLRQAITEAHARPDLLATAETLGIADATGMENPRLRALIRQRQAEAEAAARPPRNIDPNSPAGLQAYEARKRIDSRYREPDEADVPVFLRPNAIGRRAAELSREDRNIFTGRTMPGLPPQEAAAKARQENEGERRAAYEAERARLMKLYQDAYGNAETDVDRDRATRAFMAAQEELSTKYRIGQP